MWSNEDACEKAQPPGSLRGKETAKYKGTSGKITCVRTCNM